MAQDSRYKIFPTQESLKVLMPVSTRDKSIRADSIETISRTLLSWVDGYGSPTTDSIFHNGDVNHYNVLVQDQLPDILRLSIQCPFQDVRDTFAELLQELQMRGVKVPKPIHLGASQFIHDTQVVPVNTGEKQTQMLFVDAFLQNNRLEHVTQVMGYHPQYLDCFLKTQHYLLRGDGPLPFDYRHYIAIMASARHQCSYLVNLHTTEFIMCGGDEKWLQGLDQIPQKLQDLYDINKILAHRPWLIEKSHIEKLTKGNNNWALSEVMHALILLAHFHALSSFIYGCGINPEIDHEGHTFQAASDNGLGCDNGTNGTSTSPRLSELGIEKLMETMKKLQEDNEEKPEEELLKRFQNVESAPLPASVERPSSPKGDVYRYVNDPDFIYKDFFSKNDVTRQKVNMPTLRAQDYSWEDQGFSLANRLYPDIGALLDDKFRMSYTLTYYTMGNNQDVDTTSFRTAIWNYIHCMFGIRHDDYDYGEVNLLLERNLKAYVKTVTCYPERVTKKDYDNFMREFKHSEKVHVNLMLHEARFQAELLYALRAINRYMT